MRSTSSPPVDDVDRLRLTLLRLARRIRVNAVGVLTPSQHAVFVSVAKHGPCTIGEIAEHEQVKPPSASKIVAALEEHGLIARQSDPSDRRCSLVAVAPAGHRYLRDFKESTRAWLGAQLDALDPSDQAAIRDALPALERLVGGSS